MKKTLCILLALISIGSTSLYADSNSLNKEIADIQKELVELKTKTGKAAKMSQKEAEKRINKLQKDLNKKVKKAKKETNKGVKNIKKDLKKNGKNIKKSFK